MPPLSRRPPAQPSTSSPFLTDTSTGALRSSRSVQTGTASSAHHSLRSSTSTTASNASSAQTTTAAGRRHNHSSNHDGNPQPLFADRESEDAEQQQQQQQQQQPRQRRQTFATRRATARRGSPDQRPSSRAARNVMGALDAVVPEMGARARGRGAIEEGESGSGAAGSAAVGTGSQEMVNRRADGSFILDLVEGSSAAALLRPGSWGPGYNEPGSGGGLVPSEQEREAEQLAELDRHYAAIARQFFASGAAIDARGGSAKKIDEEADALRMPMMMRLREQAMQRLEEERWQFEA